MKLFNKKKKTKKNSDSEKIEKELNNKLTAKDLKKLDKEKTDEPKKQEKEKPKPWGKSERYLLLFIFLLLTGGSAILALTARSGKLPYLPRISPSSLTLEKTYVLEGRNSQYSDEINAVLDRYEALTNDYSGVYALYVYRLTTGVSYGVFEDEILQAASLIKLPLMTAFLLEVEKGEYELDSTYVLREEDKIAGAGVLYNQPAGTSNTYRELLNLMGKHSDNTAFNIIRKKMGDERINELFLELGLGDTNLNKNTTSARDIGNLLRKIWEEKIIDTEHGDLIIKSITDTDYEKWLVAGVDAGVTVSHKYGRETGVVNDAGIVFVKGNPYVIVIMGNGVVEKEADKLIPELSSFIYQLESSQ